MLTVVFQQQKQKKNILILLSIFGLLLALYTFLDNYGFQSYTILGDAFGYNVVVSTIVLNILLSALSAFTISITLINYRLQNAMTSGSIFASIGNVFAVIFSGCASCGLSLFGALGVAIGLPVITPGAVKYKFFALLIILLGLIIVLYVIQTSVCKIKSGGVK
jgi:hypothetical protein